LEYIAGGTQLAARHPLLAARHPLPRGLWPLWRFYPLVDDETYSMTSEASWMLHLPIQRLTKKLKKERAILSRKIVVPLPEAYDNNFNHSII
jgi:hypothetical protein